MTRQKSERRVVATSTRKRRMPQTVEPAAAVNAAPVNKQTRQLTLHLGTAELLAGQTERAVGGAAADLSAAAPFAVPKPRSNTEHVSSATMEAVCQRLDDALQNVGRNQGAPGPDGQSVTLVRQHWPALRISLTAALLHGDYKPGEIRRVWIPKASAGVRGLGIPNVVDRVVQEAVRLMLEPLYEPTFHDSSHGFRPGRSCHTAIAAARSHLEDGYEWVVDLDLESFFDRVNHQRLRARLAERVSDGRVLGLITSMLRAAVVMPDGVVVSSDEGVPQGGPLSPLLSNLVLDELDQELDRRGHKFVRYADDCNIYVRSERAGHRVMASVTAFLERRLRLKVNAAKSAVARPEERHFLGFRLRREPLDGSSEVSLSKRSRSRIDAKILALTPRRWGRSLSACIAAVNVYLRGWLGFFGICTQGIERTLGHLDAHIRRRLRAIQLRHWKSKLTIIQRLVRLGVSSGMARRSISVGRRSYWALSHSAAVHRGLNNAHFGALGLMSLRDTWMATARALVAPVQLTLALG